MTIVNGKKKVRRKKRRRNNYFTKETQASIVKFQNETIEEKKQEIYKNDIFPAFEKLAESLIILYINDYPCKESLKIDCVSFLYETLPKWDPGRGCKAFSYFNVVAKNFLIVNHRKFMKNVKRHVPINKLSQNDKKLLEIKAMNNIDTPFDILAKKQKKDEIMKYLNLINRKITKNNNEKACINAVIQLFENSEHIDMLNKRAVLLYLREISGLNSKQLSASLSSIRKLYKKHKKQSNVY